MIRRPAQRRLRAALGVALLLLLPAVARGHWLKPEEVVAGIDQDPALRQHLGLVGARVDPKLPRLLLVRIRRTEWDKVPAEKRLALAQVWYDEWRHNVPEGIVAVLDVDTEKSLVHFDPSGTPRLVEPQASGGD